MHCSVGYVWDVDEAATQEDKQAKLEETLVQATAKPQVASRSQRFGTIQYQQALRVAITVYDTPQLQYIKPRVGPLIKTLDHFQVQGLRVLAPQVAGYTSHDKDVPTNARHCEEVANDVGVMEISEQTRSFDLCSWDADVPRWFLQKFLYRDCLPSVNAPPDTTMSASSESINFQIGLRLDWSVTTGLQLFARAVYGYGTRRVLRH